MAETPQEIVNRELREFKRYTGDGLPGEPINAPLPIGDPQSGNHNPKKANLRRALLSPLAVLHDAVEEAEREADRSRDEANRSNDAADRAVSAAAGVEYPVSYEEQSLTPGQKAQARTNIGALDISHLREVNHAYLLQSEGIIPGRYFLELIVSRPGMLEQFVVHVNGGTGFVHVDLQVSGTVVWEGTAELGNAASVGALNYPVVLGDTISADVTDVIGNVTSLYMRAIRSVSE